MNTLEYFAKGSSGGRSSGGARAAPKSSPSSNSTTKSQQNATNTNKDTSTTKTTTRPSSSTQKTTTATKPTKTTSSTGRKFSNEGYVVNDSYKPRFTNGYTPPPNSTVYYPEHSALDWLPWIYIFSQNSPRHDETVIVQPDGKEVIAKPEPEGIDGLLIVNWIMLILIALAIVGGIAWLVNKHDQKKKAKKASSERPRNTIWT